jgi:hypothetical protein
VLNRTIVMPEWQCWCDQDWYASVLADCRMASSDLETPFRCPTDVFFHSTRLDETLVHFRPASFLSSPRVSTWSDETCCADVLHRNQVVMNPNGLQAGPQATHSMQYQEKAGVARHRWHWCSTTATRG